MDVLLARAPSRTLPFLYEDLGLEVVAASLRAAGASCRIDDGVQEACSARDYVERLANAPEPIVGMTLHSELVVDRHLALLREVKRACPEKLVVVGGHPVAVIESEIAEKYAGACDIVVVGEGDQTMVELWRHAAYGTPALEDIPGISFDRDGRRVRTGMRPRAAGASRPPAARDAWERPASRPLTNSALVAFSQGCNQRCTFCSVAAFHGPGQDDWRARPVDEFLAEVAGLRDRYGVTDFTIVDPNFIGCAGDGEALVRAFCDGIRRARLDIRFEIAARVDSLTPPVIEQLRDAGLLRIFVGIESGQEEQLAAWRKGIHPDRSVQVMRELVNAGVYVEIGMIVLRPDSTLEDVRTDVAFLRRLPYFNLYNLDQAIWPLHVGRGRYTTDEALLDPSPARIFRTYAYRDDRVRQFAAACGSMGRGLGDLFYRVRKRAWDNLARVPGVLGRFCEVQRSMLEPYLGAVDEAIALIGGGVRDDRLADAIAGHVERLRPGFVQLVDGFSAEVERTGGGPEDDRPAR